MGSKIKEMKNIINQTSRYDLIFNKYKNLALSSFSWEGLPEKIESRYIEQALFTFGQAVFFNDKDYGLMCLPCSNAGKLNVNGEPLKVIATGFGFSRIVDLKEGVLIRNNPTNTSTESYLRQYAEDMLEVERSMKANIKQQKFPYCFITDEKTRLSMRNIFKKIEDCEPVIYINEGLSLENFQFFDTQAPYVADKLREERYELEREILTFLGLNNNFEKSERLLVDEINSNNDFICRNAELMFEERQKASKKINEIFSLNISVKNNNILHETLKVGDKNGELHD